FLWNTSNGKDEKSQGKKHMLAGLIGLFIMLTAYSIIGFVLATFNVPWPPGSSSATSNINTPYCNNGACTPTPAGTLY
ncbi:MAG: hypothetical protein ACREGH_02140, partial [Minisyncoccia bacterium]